MFLELRFGFLIGFMLLLCWVCEVLSLSPKNSSLIVLDWKLVFFELRSRFWIGLMLMQFGRCLGMMIVTGTLVCTLDTYHPELVPETLSVFSTDTEGNWVFFFISCIWNECFDFYVLVMNVFEFLKSLFVIALSIEWHSSSNILLFDICIFWEKKIWI